MSSPNSDVPPTVLVFRKRLLTWSETFVADQGRCLPRWRAVFTGISPDASGGGLLTEADERCLLRDHPQPWPAWLAPTLFKRLGWVPGAWSAALRDYQPRLLHAHFGPDALAALPLARHLGLPLVATFHGFDICIDRPRNRYRRQRHLIFDRAARVIAVSHFIAARLIAHGCPPEKLVHHSIGIDLDRFAPAIGGARHGIAFVGRLVEKKGCADLLNALALLRGEAAEHPLQIIGDGPLAPSLRQLAHELGLAARVVFHGRQPPERVKDLVGRSALLCVPSRTGIGGDAEGLGMVFLEAQALGTPVVSTRHGGIPEAVIDGSTGLLVEEGRPDALAEALTHLLSHPSDAAAFGQAGIAHVHKHFDLRRQCALLETVYETVVT